MKQYYVTGSHGNDYVVTFEKQDDGSIRTKCTCSAGVFGQICKHVMGLIEENAEVAEMLSASGATELLNEYNQEHKEAERMQAKAKRTKKRLAELLGLKAK